MSDALLDKVFAQARHADHGRALSDIWDGVRSLEGSFDGPYAVPMRRMDRDHLLAAVRRLERLLARDSDLRAKAGLIGRKDAAKREGQMELAE